MEYNYKKLLSVVRKRPTTIKRTSAIDEFYSDRSRIIYSSSFRRLQQKAQVFSLEPNASVRTRLTHSLEVSDLGRTLANRIAHKLLNNELITVRTVPYIVAIVENACLLHDIGNPPFGHFGETAIRDWAQKRATDVMPEDVKKDELLKLLMNDFLEFDGNPQGFRTITRLHTEYDEFSLNLTYATLLCDLKYSRAAGEAKGEGILKKAGYFQSEKDLVEEIYDNVGIEQHHRFPLTYIMEAADDIAYCMSDIADGIEKGILTESDFIFAFHEEWESLYKAETIPIKIPDISNLNGFNRDISVPWSRMAMDEAVNNYFKNHESFYRGIAKELIPKDSDIGRVLNTVKQVSRKKLYTSIEAESIELTGYAVITGILKSYERLLCLPYSSFIELVKYGQTDNADIERRLFNRLGKRYIAAYSYSIEKLESTKTDFAGREWWLRAHLLLDHVSGMTDEFALETYQMLQGIRQMRT